MNGTEGAQGYEDYKFHARAFLKASVFGATELRRTWLLGRAG